MTAISASATTIVVPTDEQLVAKSPAIVRGLVVSTDVVERDGALWTETLLDVEQTLKGSVASRILIREIGGQTENRVTKIFGTPQYRNGERVLVFVAPTGRGDYQTVDLFVGKFAEERTMAGQRLWTRDDATANVRLLDADFREIEAANVQRDAIGFERFIASRNAGRAAVENYGVENPVIDRPALRNTTRDRLSSDFTLIDEPTVYRWFAFQRGTTIQWFSHGQQVGYAGGGINEVRTGMASWTSYTSARILYNYTGAASGSPTTLNSPNGVNDIIFNDARNEITGSWSPSTGGVVGTGGFNGVRSRESFTTTFAADATHPQGTLQAFDITEGHMTIQDGVSPANGISSAELAEIIAHEFGHTLGFGHSLDGTALMFRQVTGIGSHLRADDQTAARWLYPSGSAPTPTPTPTQIPPAPSNLVATPSGTTVSLSWNDNATNETAQAVYVAAGNGPYSKIGDLAANSRTAVLTGFSAGTFRIYVTASNSAGESSASNVATVSITSPQGVAAAFTANTFAGTVGVTNFTFTDQSTGPVATRLWEFGDGDISNATNPSHVYRREGQYTVALTVTGAGSTSTATRVVNVTIPDIPVVAAFSFLPQNPTTGSDISFTDASTGGVSAWVWTFGDGSISTDQNPVKRYSLPGTYTVTLTAYRNNRNNVASTSITVTAPLPVTPAIAAQFDFSPSNPDVGTAVSFTDRSVGSPTGWLWSFGDGASSTSKNPTHTFNAAGQYFVTLTSSNGGSSGSTTHPIVVSPRVFVYRSTIPVTTQTTGLGGANWRTELSLFNAGDEATSVKLSFIPGAGGAPLTRSIFVGPRQAAVYANALLDLFGLSNSAGGIAIEAESASSTPALKVSSRTFTNGTRGTYGQAVPDIDGTAYGQMLYLTGLESDAQYRTNIGIVNKGAAPVGVTLLLLDANGIVLGTRSLTVAENSFGQTPLASYFPVVANVEHRVLSMQVDADANDAISVYASVINSETADPVYIQAIPAVKNNRLVLPVVGRLPGANGTFFRSDVTYFNPTFTTLSLSTRYLPASSDNRNAVARTLTVLPGRTVVQADILSSLGLTSGSGSLEITWNGSNGPIVTSRTYTSTETGGTFGQSIDPIQSFARRIDVTGLRSDISFRSNVGFVNGGDAAIGIDVALVTSNGQTLRTASIQLAPKSQVQYQLSGLFPGLDTGTVGSFTLRAESGAATMFAYGSIVDNGSGDAVYFAGR